MLVTVVNCYMSSGKKEKVKGFFWSFVFFHLSAFRILCFCAFASLPLLQSSILPTTLRIRNTYIQLYRTECGTSRYGISVL